MNIVEQIVLAVEVGAKVAWITFFSCLAAIATELYFPELFEGLPAWMLPTIRLVAILTLVISISSTIIPFFKHARSLFSFLFNPIRRVIIRNRLFKINIGELHILSLALADRKRYIRLNPDGPEVMILLDKGLIVKDFYGAIFMDGLSGFEIPNTVWRVMLSMEEFTLPDLSASADILRNPSRINRLQSALPQKHPAVQRSLSRPTSA